MSATARFRRILDEGKCIGCGICAAMVPEKLSMGLAPFGWLRPALAAELAPRETDAILEVCPGVVQTGLPADLIDEETTVDEVWGPLVRLDMAHAADADLRHRAATGGALTALADYLVASGKVGAVLHVKAGGAKPSFGTPQVSSDRAGVLAGAGSRYGPADPLSALGGLLDRGEPFAVVAKPCDISALRLLGRRDPRVGALVTHMLTMVCGGYMPTTGMNAFYTRLGVARDDVAAVRYRGHGCPGPTRVERKSGGAVERTYLEFWGTDASMWHLAWRCKICPDGTGEAADIAAADTWPGGSPTEEMMASDPGTNVIIARTQAGAQLVAEAAAAGYLTLDGTASTEDLDLWQPHQVARKIASGARFEGLRRAGHRGINTIGLRTGALRRRMDPKTDRRQVEGTEARISIGKHRDDFGVGE